MGPGGEQEDVGSQAASHGARASERPGVDLAHWMQRYQEADTAAPGVLIAHISPTLLRFFQYQGASRDQAEDLLQDTWLRIHRVRYTYRPGEPLLPWIYAIARHVRVDHYRRSRRIASHEIATETLPEPSAGQRPGPPLPEFESMVGVLPDSQREIVTMLKVGGLSIEEVARATSLTAGAVKQKAHRAYRKLRELLEAGRAEASERGER